MRRPSVIVPALLLLGVLVSTSARAQVVDTTAIAAVGAVRAMARDGDTIYIGGQFSLVGTASGGAFVTAGDLFRTRLAAHELTTHAVTKWDLEPDAAVAALGAIARMSCPRT